MKALFCSPNPTEDPRLGASRVILDLAEAWRAQGWACDVYSAKGRKVSFSEYPSHLGDYLKAHAADYDVVDYPYHCKPWIDERHKAVLKVARSVLLKEHCQLHPDPQPPASIRSRLGNLRRLLKQWVGLKAADQSTRNQEWHFAHADRITVGNSKDKARLIQLGIPQSKILVIPYGLTDPHLKRLLTCTPSLETDEPTLAFLGTFDYRKGCLDFAEIYDQLAARFPGLQLKLIGTSGMCPDASAVYRFFPQRIHGRITVIPCFEPEELPGILDGCSAGLFPSYREGFGIGVVEMLAAGLPVVAYDAPGPCDILPEAWLAPRGDRLGLVERLIAVLNDSDRTVLIQRARSTAERFLWSDIVRETHRTYGEALSRIR